MNTTQTVRFHPAHLSAFERFNMPTTCGCCGREGLKKTVKVTDGTRVLFMGTGCAMKACRMGEKSFAKAQAEASAKRYNDNLDRLCPDFAGSYMKQMALVGCGNHRRADVYDRTGKIDALTADEGRDGYTRTCEAIARGITYEKNFAKVTERFDGSDVDVAASYARASFVAWRGEEEAVKRGIGSAKWLQSVREMYV